MFKYKDKKETGIFKYDPSKPMNTHAMYYCIKPWGKKSSIVGTWMKSWIIKDVIDSKNTTEITEEEAFLEMI